MAMTKLDRVARSGSPDAELSDRQLDQVAGGKGKVHLAPFTFTKKIDVASPMLS
jgi:type VI protein secretion system component Hcp